MVATGDDLMDKVASVLQDVSHDVIEPRFEKLHQDDIRFKSPGEMVTVADELAERQLKARLGELVPDALFVGEEAFSDGSGLPSALRHQRIWLVDPLDGTANFVSGSPHWAVMAALVQDGETCAAWIWQPVRKAMYRAEVGAGATRNGVPIERSPAPSAPGPRSVQNFWFLGGAVNEDFAEDSVAFSREGARIFWECVGQWDGPEHDATFTAWVDGVADALATNMRENGYVNLTTDRGPAWLRGLYGSQRKFDRLVEAKTAWDPGNLLRFNKNFEPARRATVA